MAAPVPADPLDQRGPWTDAEPGETLELTEPFAVSPDLGTLTG